MWRVQFFIVGVVLCIPRWNIDYYILVIICQWLTVTERTKTHTVHFWILVSASLKRLHQGQFLWSFISGSSTICGRKSLWHLIISIALYIPVHFFLSFPTKHLCLSHLYLFDWTAITKYRRLGWLSKLIFFIFLKLIIIFKILGCTGSSLLPKGFL